MTDSSQLTKSEMCVLLKTITSWIANTPVPPEAPAGELPSRERWEYNKVVSASFKLEQQYFKMPED